jgi:hypothetical protein
MDDLPFAGTLIACFATLLAVAIVGGPAQPARGAAAVVRTESTPVQVAKAATADCAKVALAPAAAH